MLNKRTGDGHRRTTGGSYSLPHSPMASGPCIPATPPCNPAVQDWTAVEQAHLRMALAEQQDKQVDAARRTFQRGTAACPSSDTLFMAWALMESKIHNPRSRKVARALLRRAVSLNPKRHSNILRWRVFLELKEAGEAAVEIMCNTLATSPPVTSSSTTASASATTLATAATAERISSIPDASIARDATSKGSAQGGSSGSASSGAPADFITRWAKRMAATKERSLSSEVLAMCVAATKAKQEGRANGRPGAEKEDQATRLEEAIRSLEDRGRGHVGDSAHGRVLSGSWRLAYTNCPVCERVLTREGLDFYQKLSAPIREISPKAGEPPVPFRCEVIVAPSADARLKRNGGPSVSHFLRGWAQARISGASGQLKLRQQVAPRRSARLTAGYRPGSFGEPLPPALPSVALRALGDVVRGGVGLEKLVTQDVTYIGGRLRVARSRDGKVFVYERCMWPRDQRL